MDSLAAKCDGPAQCCGITKTRITGSPDPKHVSTSYVERINLEWACAGSRDWPMGIQKDRESPSRAGDLLYVLQFYADSFRFARHARDGSERSNHMWSIEEIVGLI